MKTPVPAGTRSDLSIPLSRGPGSPLRRGGMGHNALLEPRLSDGGSTGLPEWGSSMVNRFLAGVFLTVVFAGCSIPGPEAPFDPGELEQDYGWLAVRDLPVFRQKEDSNCGTAGLEMILSYWMVPPSPGELVESFPAASTEGVKARELRDFARARELLSFLYRGQWDDLEYELGEGHPVLVGLVKPSVSGPLAHYEVVVAVHPELRKVVTLDPCTGWRQNSYDEFWREWEAAGFLTLVFFREERHPHPRSS